MRLQKFMAEAGVASRRQCEKFIQEGRVLLNGEQALIGSLVNPEKDIVVFDGARVALNQRRVVLLFYKPRGVICTSSDPEGRKTVQEYFRQFPERLYNVGRLDIDSEGLLVMTNDGAIAERMTHPRYEIEKCYFAVCDGELKAEEAQALQKGVLLEDGVTAPARIRHMTRTKTGQTSFQIIIHEGKNRQIRRMIEAVGHKTLLLKRERVGELRLGQLKPGEWREATEAELAWLATLTGARTEEDS